MTLLAEIQEAALDSSVNLADLLRRCKVLAARLKHAAFGEWVHHELNGYPSGVDVPPYRILKAGSLGSFSGAFGAGMQNVPIPPSNVPGKLRHIVTDLQFRDPIISLVELSRGGEPLHAPWPADLVKLVQTRIYENMSLLDAWRVVTPAAIGGIVDTVRTRILDFVLALQEKMPAAGDVAPGKPAPLPPETITNIFNTTIVGGAANIGTSGSPSIHTGKIVVSTAIPKAKQAEVRKVLGRLREQVEATPEEDRGEARQTLARIEEQLASPRPNFEKLKRYLALLGTLATVATPTVELLKTILEAIFTP